MKSHTADLLAQPRYRALKAAARSQIDRYGLTAPLLLIDTHIIGEQFLALRAAIPRAHIHYAVKANPEISVLKTLVALGSRFEIASPAELDTLLGLGVAPNDIICSNPIKSAQAISYAYASGLRWFATDSLAETRKLHQYAPDAVQYVRLPVSNADSDYPLTSKFGLFAPELSEWMDAASALGVDVGGVHFHVGSQCRSVSAWGQAIAEIAPVLEQLQQRGFRLRSLNLGGGYPISYGNKMVPDIASIGQALSPVLENIPASWDVVVEPGRYMSGPSGLFICQVVNIQYKQGKRWVYIDAGIFNGLYEIRDGFFYPLQVNGQDCGGNVTPAILAGPTCDSVDVLTDALALPDDLKESDALWFYHSGVYTHNLVCAFNGMAAPKILVVD